MWSGRHMHVGWEKRAVARALKQRYTLRRFSRAFWNLEGISFSLVSQENSEHPFFRKSGNLHGSQTHIEPEKVPVARDNMIFLVFYVFVVLLGEFCSSCSCAQVYVVYMGKGLQGSTENRHDMLRLHHQMLTAVHDGSLTNWMLGLSMEKAEASHVYTYSNGFQGFAAKLNKQQAMKLANMPGVISVFPNTKRSLHTTHSWDFMGLSVDAAAELPELSSKNQENEYGQNLLVSEIMECLRFLQDGEGNASGERQTHHQISPVTGGRYYLRGYQTEESGQSRSAIKFISPRDSSGHGSHTASIAAGRFVRNMNYRGLGTGGGRGGAPMARIAAYKTCWDAGCYDADILAAFDDAIADGVDIISVSLGPDYPQGGYFTDAISIGSFHATSNGILVVSSAGNAGRKGSATNLAPWILTVAAGTTDRSFPSYIRMANGTLIMGESLSTYHMHTSVRTISASEANASSFTPYQSSLCLDSSLNRTKARGKILICHRAKGSSDSRVSKSMVVKEAGALGMILIDEMEDHVANHFALPATVVGKATGDKILSYISSTRFSAKYCSYFQKGCGSTMILPAKTILGSRDAPRVAAFSSRGPNSLTPEILKPDIAAPGLNILAAWSPSKEDKHFNILSGTSMACPHVTGIAALVKGAYPSWSPSAIKSAIMTTATVLGNKRNAIATDPNGRTATPFDFGSGFADPIKALNPGIIFDAHPEDYKSFLCSIGYDDHSLHLITQDNSSCTDRAPSSAAALNYPSITIPNLKKSYSVTRTMTNVGCRGSAYHAFVSAPLGINVTVTPKVLVFENYGAKKTFTVNFHVDVPQRDHVFGSLLWHGKDARLMMPLVVKVDTAAKA
uniref:Subtilisin-like protease n=1 Tax=Oryza glumipatula TaxID=40148 RepID=A0A0E0AC14_9ORYZ